MVDPPLNIIALDLFQQIINREPATLAYLYIIKVMGTLLRLI
jgi:hypothetical protein